MTSVRPSNTPVVRSKFLDLGSLDRVRKEFCEKCNVLGRNLLLDFFLAIDRQALRIEQLENFVEDKELVTFDAIEEDRVVSSQATVSDAPAMDDSMSRKVRQFRQRRSPVHTFLMRIHMTRDRYGYRT